jgi:flagellar biogenesis protein FliO
MFLFFMESVNHGFFLKKISFVSRNSQFTKKFKILHFYLTMIHIVCWLINKLSKIIIIKRLDKSI